MKNGMKLAAVLTAGMLLVSGASAQQLKIEGDELKLPAAAAIDGETVETVVTELDVLGKCAGDRLLAKIGDELVFIDGAAFEIELPGVLNAEELRDFGDCSDVTKGSPKETAMTVQQMLADAGYLDGGVDGIFGNGSAAAVTAFQTDAGLEPTGIADLATQLKLYETAYGENAEVKTVKYPVEADMSGVFGDFAAVASFNLQPFAKEPWQLTYDDLDGKGELAGGFVIGSYEYSAVPIDRIAVDAELTVVIDNGSAYPAIKVTATGAYGVYIQTVTVKGGAAVVKLETPEVERTTKGASILETAMFRITEDALEMLRGADGKLQIRVNGVNNEYDLVPAEDMSFLGDYTAAIAKANIIEEE